MFVRCARRSTEDLALLDEVNLDTQFLNRRRICKVPVQTVGFLDEDYSAVRVLLEMLDHRIKSWAAGPLGCVHIDELLIDDATVLGSVRSQ